MTKDELIEKYLQLNEKKKEVEAELAEVKKDLKLEMRMDDLKEYDNETANVYYSEVKRNNLDKKKLVNYITKEELEQCYTESVYDKLDVKRKKDEQ